MIHYMKTIKKILTVGILAGIIVGCEDLKFGSSFLEKPLSEDVNIDTVFAHKKYADQALNHFYKSLPDFMLTSSGGCHQGGIMDGFSDVGFGTGSIWATGSVNATTKPLPYYLWHSEGMGAPHFGIRKAYIYLENVDRVPDMTEEEKIIRKAEAKVVIALQYVLMIRLVGGMPWIDHAYKADETAMFPRMTLEETVNKTVALLDEAAKDLPWYNPTDEEYGHMTAAAALALKFRLLLFTASPLFNGDKPYYEGQASTDLLTWFGDYQENRWERALEAGKEFLRMNKQNGDYFRIENTGNPQEDFVNGYFVKGNREVLLPTFRWGTYVKGNKAFKQFEQGKGNPRGSYADMFQWKDGSKFDWNNSEHRAYPFFDAEGMPTRDARLYETLLVNGDKWQNRTAEVYVGGREGYGGGSKVGDKTRYGYGYRKFLRDLSGEMDKKPYSCPWIRMPEIYLSMAEVLNHVGKANQADEFGMTAYDYLNLVHTRAGLPSVTAAEVASGEPLQNYVFDERAREFGMEDMRYYDMVRYKKGNEWGTRPLEMLETTKTGGVFTYNVTVHEESKYMWKEYWYLLPFPVTEVNKKYGLIQNPGWD